MKCHPYSGFKRSMLSSAINTPYCSIIWFKAACVCVCMYVCSYTIRVACVKHSSIVTAVVFYGQRYNNKNDSILKSYVKNVTHFNVNNIQIKSKFVLHAQYLRWIIRFCLHFLQNAFHKWILSHCAIDYICVANSKMLICF